jgi:hypothetical protein
MPPAGIGDSIHPRETNLKLWTPVGILMMLNPIQRDGGLLRADDTLRRGSG